ncbi:TPA: hypothetical protein ACH3X2_006810 [Trebouxia sp. C0005]
MPVNRYAGTNTHRKISLNTRCVIYAIYSRTRGDRIYIGITYQSSWQRFKGHLKAARRYLNVPPQARDHGKATHALYRVWGKYGIKDSALMPLLVLGRPGDFADRADFHARMDHHEAYFIDVAKTLSPRGYNVRNTNQAKRKRNRATARRKRENRAIQNQPSPNPDPSSDSDPDNTPPPPPLSPQGRLLAGQAAAPALGAAPGGQPSPVSALPYSSYARRAYIHLRELRLLQNTFTWNAATNTPSTSLVGENPVLTYLKVCHMRALTKMSRVMGGFSITNLDRCRPAGASCSWTFDDVQFLLACIAFCVAHHAQRTPRDRTQAARKLLILPFHSIALDKAHVNRILHSQSAVDAILPAHRPLVGSFTVGYRYDHPIGRQWHNTKRYAFMTSAQWHAIRTAPCGCSRIASRYKLGDHLLTSHPDLLPTCNLQHVCRLGSKYRPIVSGSSSVMDPDTRRAILAMLRPAIEGFARSAEERICMHHSMQAWIQEVMSQLSHALDAIPDGTSLHPPGALPYTHDDEVAMRRFLDSFKGCGLVCTSMDKAETTLMFMCPKLYVDNLLTDLETGATCQPATLSHADLLHVHNGFCRQYGIPVDMTCQAMPHYVGTCKMHKDPPGMRFISSSHTSSMRSVSLVINKLLT